MAEVVASKRQVVHVAVHTFAPVLEGEVRNAAVGLLYDSRRPAEAELCHRWAEILRRLEPGCRVRRNYPYQGKTDGLPTWIRRRHPESEYLGVELEVNQLCVDGPSWRRFQERIAESLRELLAED